MNESWSVTYTWHDHDEVWHIETKIIVAESLGGALDTISNYLVDKMETEDWSDFYVTSISVIPEMH